MYNGAPGKFRDKTDSVNVGLHLCILALKDACAPKRLDPGRMTASDQSVISIHIEQKSETWRDPHRTQLLKCHHSPGTPDSIGTYSTDKGLPIFARNIQNRTVNPLFTLQYF